MKIFVLFFSLIFTAIGVFSQAPTGLELVNKMFEKGTEIKTLKYDMRMKERVKGKYPVAKNLFKVQVSPYKMYLKQEFPLTDMELLYVEGANNNNVIVHPSGFPWTTINLEVNSSHMRKNLHHPVTDSGLNYVFSVLLYLMNKYQSVIDKIITYDGNVTWKGALCYKLTFTNPNFKYQSYTLKPGDTPFSIARKLHINDYMILDKNPELESFEDCKVGMTIKIPVDYASKMEIWLDQKTFIPAIMKIYDDAGLYEEFEFSNIIPNFKFQPNEFTCGFKDYHF